VDEFVSKSRGNYRIDELILYPSSFNDSQDEHVWERLGEVICNLRALRTINILALDEAAGLMPWAILGLPDWERLAYILRHVRQSVKIKIDCSYQWATQIMLPFAQAIRGHPTITSFLVGNHRAPYESMSILYSALATLPALESVQLCCDEPDASTLS
jgi:hypothetical protein